MVQEGIAEARRRQEEGEAVLLDQLLQDNFDEENVSRLLTDLFLAAADTVSRSPASLFCSAIFYIIFKKTLRFHKQLYGKKSRPSSF